MIQKWIVKIRLVSFVQSFKNSPKFITSRLEYPLKQLGDFNEFS